MTPSRRTVITVGLLSSILAACGSEGPDADRLNEVVRGVDGVKGSSLTIEKPGGGREYAGGELSTADVGAPLNPSSYGLWQHYKG